MRWTFIVEVMARFVDQGWSKTGKNFLQNKSGGRSIFLVGYSKQCKKQSRNQFA